MNGKKIAFIAWTAMLISCPMSSLLSQSVNKKGRSTDQDRIRPEKTSFQTGAPWKPTTDFHADIAMVYGANDRPGLPFEKRAQSWRDHGYQVQFMTGMAWGSYQDYVMGKWDGVTHWEEAQMQQNGDTVLHGRNSPYYVPTENYLKYIKQAVIKRVIDAGISTIYLEEPEFWVKSGYSAAFKKEWKKYYGYPWKPQHVSAANMYLSNKLKYFLYYRALKECFGYAKKYGASKGITVHCYVATHSLLNYALWDIVSPEASLASLPEVDGYIVQTWTGTAREPNYFNGIAKSRAFPTAFLEYGCMRSMTAPTNRKLFFENDPVEDVRRDWADYKKNYQTTFAAQLFYPDIDNYEVMPWPDRIFDGKYYVSQTSDQKAPMPKSYSTQLLVMINSLNNMQVTENKTSGTQGISVMMGNALMFQRLPTHDDGKAYEDPYFSNFYETSGMFHRFATDTRLSDPQLANFYGEALPFLMRGVPVGIVHLENTGYPKAFENTQVLLMTYSNMKPLSEKAHKYLTSWVRGGGVLVYSGRDQDPFQTVPEWWNKDGKHFKCPADDLFIKLGIGENPKAGTYNVGKGKICVIRHDPKEFVLHKDADTLLRNRVEALYQEKTGDMIQYKNNFYLARGAYDIVSVLQEDPAQHPAPYKINGTLIDLFDPTLPVLKQKLVQPGQQAYLLNIDRVPDKNKAQVLASASRITKQKRSRSQYSFVAKGPENTVNVMRILLPGQPKRIQLKDNAAKETVITPLKSSWDESSKTYLLSFENESNGVRVQCSW